MGFVISQYYPLYFSFIIIIGSRKKTQVFCAQFSALAEVFWRVVFFWSCQLWDGTWKATIPNKYIKVNDHDKSSLIGLVKFCEIISQNLHGAVCYCTSEYMYLFHAIWDIHTCQKYIHNMQICSPPVKMLQRKWAVPGVYTGLL